MIKIKKVYKVKVLTDWRDTTQTLLPIIYTYVVKETSVKVQNSLIDITQKLTFYCDSYNQAIECIRVITKNCPPYNWAIVKSIKPKYVLCFETNDFN